MDPYHIPLIKSKNDTKAKTDSVKNKLHRYPTSEESDVYEFKMALFDNGYPEEFLLFMRNFKMTLEASGTLAASANLQYLRTILCGEALRQFDNLCVQVGSTTTTHLIWIILGLGMYFFLLMHCQSKGVKCAVE